MISWFRLMKDFFLLTLGVDPSQDSKQIPLTLGRSFLATANANMNCRLEEMDVSLRLNIFEASSQPVLNLNYSFFDFGSAIDEMDSTLDSTSYRLLDVHL